MKKRIIIVLAISSIPLVFAQSADNTYRNRSEISGGIGYSSPINGVIEKLYINSMPNMEVSVELTSGNFLDCGYGVISQQTDDHGRKVIELSCGVAISETLAVPASSTPARAIIHF